MRNEVFNNLTVESKLTDNQIHYLIKKGRESKAQIKNGIEAIMIIPIGIFRREIKSKLWEVAALPKVA